MSTSTAHLCDPYATPHYNTTQARDTTLTTTAALRSAWARPMRCVVPGGGDGDREGAGDRDRERDGAGDGEDEATGDGN